MHLSLKGRAREAVRGISINDLKNDDGAEQLSECFTIYGRI